jgi:hypothetical protein
MGKRTKAEGSQPTFSFDGAATVAAAGPAGFPDLQQLPKAT